MDYDKLTTEELFEEFQKEYYKASEIASDSLNTTNSRTIHDDLLNLTDLEEYGNKFFLTSQQTEELSKFIEVAKKLDDRLTPTARGTSFVENFILEHNEFGTNKTGIKEWEEFSAKAPDDISGIDDDINEADRLRREAEEEITDPPDDLADGDAMTEKFLDEGDTLDLTDEERAALLDDIEQIDDANDPRKLGGLDPDVDIPDDISEIEQSSIFDEYRKQDPDFDEFMNLIEAEDTQVFGADDRAESIIDNASSALTPDEQSQFLNIVDQYNNIADQLPIEQTVKKRIRNRMARLAAQLTTPSGILDLVDIWETVVFGMGMMVAAAPEIKRTADYYFKSMGKSILNFYGMPSSSIEREDVNWEHISNTMDVVEYLSPTDRLIKMLPDKQDSKYVSNYLPGFQAPQSNPDDIGQTFINTMVNMNKNKANSENQPDKLKETFIYGSTK